jgi:hypothetical protein
MRADWLWNMPAFPPDSGPSRRDSCGRALRPLETITIRMTIDRPRPEAGLKDWFYERAVSAMKRSSAEGVGCASHGVLTLILTLNSVAPSVHFVGALSKTPEPVALLWAPAPEITYSRRAVPPPSIQRPSSG